MPQVDVFLMNLPRFRDRLDNFKNTFSGEFHIVESIDASVEFKHTRLLELAPLT